MLNDQKEFVESVLEERKRQDYQWGGPEHDDCHDQFDWATFIMDRLLVIEHLSPTEFRGEMIKVAALGLAAYETSKRLDIVNGVVN